MIWMSVRWSVIGKKIGNEKQKFVMKAFYEKDPELADYIQKSYQKLLSGKARQALLRVGTEEFKEGVDLEMMYKEMHWASEGYVVEELRRGPLDAEKIERDSMKMIEFWKQIYLK